MTQNRIFIGLAAVLVAITTLTGCSKDEQSETLTAAGPKAIRLTATMQPTRTVKDLQDKQLSKATTVGIYGLTDENTTLENGDNANYQFDDEEGTLTTEGNAMLWPGNGNVTIRAYAPRQDGWNDATETKTFTVANDQSTDENYLASDLIYASASSTSQSSPVNLTFGHKLARIKMTLQAKEGFSLSKATVKLVGLLPSTTVNLEDGTIGSASGYAIDITIGSSISLDPEGSTTLYGVIVPQTVASEKTLIEVTDGDNTWKYFLPNETTLKSGQSYALKVTVGSSSNNVTSPLGEDATSTALVRQR